MVPWNNAAMETLYQIVLVLGTLSLNVMALRGLRLLRKSLPLWRSIVGVTSVLLTFLTMTTFFVPMIAKLPGFDVLGSFVGWDTLTLSLIGIGMLFGCALERAPRLQVVAANLLLAALWHASLVY